MSNSTIRASTHPSPLQQQVHLPRSTVQSLADEILHASDHGIQIPLVTPRHPNLTAHNAYQVTHAIRNLRESRGERVLGRKIGFTNRGIWEEYAVDRPNWSYVYDTSVKTLLPSRSSSSSTTTTTQNNNYDKSSSLAQQQLKQREVGEPLTTFSLAPFAEPRIEPEIILRLSHQPQPGMSTRELLGCISAVAHGFEIVQSVFPAWKFHSGVDTTAACALHAALLVGPWVSVSNTKSAELWVEQLAAFEVELYRDGERVDVGCGSNVLGSPLEALKYLVDLLEADEWNGTRLQPGEIVTTGTLTRAWPVTNGEVWETKIKGLPVDGVVVRFG